MKPTNSRHKRILGKRALGGQARLRGLTAETLAAWWLRCKGYRILARNWRSPLGEIDILARRGGIVALIEVKSRASETAAREALLAQQRRRLDRAFGLFLKSRPELRDLDARCDMIVLGSGHWPRHVKDAWRPELG